MVDQVLYLWNVKAKPNEQAGNEQPKMAKQKNKALYQLVYEYLYELGNRRWSYRLVSSYQ